MRASSAAPPVPDHAWVGMGLIVTAEGVETEAERATIATLGCDVMRGDLGSRPLHGAALQAWLDGLPAA